MICGNYIKINVFHHLFLEILCNMSNRNIQEYDKYTNENFQLKKQNFHWHINVDNSGLAQYEYRV